MYSWGSMFPDPPNTDVFPCPAVGPRLPPEVQA